MNAEQVRAANRRQATKDVQADYDQALADYKNVLDTKRTALENLRAAEELERVAEGRMETIGKAFAAMCDAYGAPEEDTSPKCAVGAGEPAR